MSLYDIIPGYKEAVVEENNTRTFAYTGLHTLIGDISVEQLTLRKLAKLSFFSNPVVTGGEITEESIVQFLIVVLDKTAEEVAKLYLSQDIEKFIQGIHLYFEYAMYDAPDSQKNLEKPIYCVSYCTIVDTLASEYGWTDEHILDIPISRIWQYIRAIQLRHDGHKILFNKSDKVKSEFLLKMNQR